MDAIKGQYSCSFKTYQLIVIFESFTGNGSGDGDVGSSNDDGTLSNHEKNTIHGLQAWLVGAKEVGHNVTGLSVKMINEWYSNGWYNFLVEGNVVFLFS